MRNSIVTGLLVTASAAALLAAAPAMAQQTAAMPAEQHAQGVNAGSLSCEIAGGMGFVFGSSKALDCIFFRPDGLSDQARTRQRQG